MAAQREAALPPVAGTLADAWARANLRSWAAFAGALLIIGYLVVPPLAYMIWTSLHPGGRFGIGGEFSFGAYRELLTAGDLGALAWNSLWFTGGSTAVGVCFGAFMAWLVARTNAPCKPLAYAAAVIGFSVPAILRAIGWVLLLGPNGFVTRYLGSLPFKILSLGGMIFVEGLLWVPVAFLMLVAPFQAMDSSLEEAGLTSGARPARVIRSITLRLLIPSLLSVTFLTAIRAFKALEVPLIVGIPGGVYTFSTYVYNLMHRSFAPDYSTSSAYGVLMAAVLSVLLGFYYRTTKEANRFQTVTGKGYRPTALDLGRWKWVAVAFLVVMFAGQVVPVGFLFLASFLPNLGIAGPLWKHLSLQNYMTMTMYPGVVSSLINSLFVAVATASGAVLLALLAAWVVVRSRISVRWMLEILLGIPLVVPGLVMSLAVLVFYLQVPIPVYGTIWILIFASLAAYAPYSMRYVHPALLQIHPELEESAYISGARPVAMLAGVLMPLLKTALIGAWVFTFLLTIRELSIVVFLYSVNTPVVATQILDMWENGALSQVTAFGSVVSLFGLAAVALAYRITHTIAAPA